MHVVNWTPYSTGILSGCPIPRLALRCIYFGLPSPLLAPLMAGGIEAPDEDDVGVAATSGQGGVIFVLEGASLEAAKVGKNYELLNCDDHANFLRRHNKDPAAYRPDICHQVPPAASRRLQCCITASLPPLPVPAAGGCLQEQQQGGWSPALEQSIHGVDGTACNRRTHAPSACRPLPAAPCRCRRSWPSWTAP